MAHIIPVFLGHLLNIEEEFQQGKYIHKHRIERKRFRDECNPFDTPEKVFIDNFRLSKDIARSLIDRLNPYLARTRAYSLTPAQKVLAALKYLATGNYQRGSVADHNMIHLSQSSVSRSLNDFLNAVDAELVRDTIKFPSTEEERASIKLGFQEKFLMPGVIGAINCLKVAIKRPNNDEEEYACEELGHSLNVQLICDSNLKILNVNPNHGGSKPDATIWNSSNVQNYLRLIVENGEKHSWLIGDGGYPLQPWLMIPIFSVDPTTPEGRYTTAHARARNVVEKLNKALKNVWQCMNSSKPLHYTPETAKKIVRTCCTLHNIGLSMPDYLQGMEEPVIEIREQHVDILESEVHTAGEVIRNQLIQMHFC